MKNLRQLCIALVLMLTLSAAAFAEGQVNCPGITQPPPTTEEQTTDIDASCGDISCGVVDVVAGIFETMLSLV